MDVEKLITEYDRRVAKDMKIAALDKAAKTGVQKIKAAKKIAEITGRTVADVLISDLVELYPDGIVPEEEAKALIVPALNRNYETVSPFAERAQAALNRENGIGLKTIVPEFDMDRAVGIAVEIANAEGIAEDLITNQIVNNSINVVDDSTRANASAQSRAGLTVRVIRRYDGRGLDGGKIACKWCLERAGEWEYSDAVARGVFERHTGCECDLYYKTTKGQWQRQNGSGWDNVSEDVIEARKRHGR